MPKSLKDTIAALKNRRNSLRDQADKLRIQAKELIAQADGLTEAIDALEPWERADGLPGKERGPGNPFDPSGMKASD